jgi:predicted aspartyl protease
MLRILLALILTISASAQTTIDVDIVGKRIHVPVSVNGGAPATFILDTGAAQTPIDRKYAEAIGLRISGSGKAHGAGGAVDIGLAPDATLTFAGEKAKIKRIPLTPLDGISLRIGEPVNGVLGYDVLRDYVTEVDYANEKVTFHPRSFKPPANAVRVPIRFDGRLPLVDARITLPDGRALAARLLLDTGAGSTMTLTRTFAEKHDIKIDPGLEASVGMGVGGLTRERIGRIPKLQVAGFTFENPVVNLSRDTKGVLSHSNFDGLIGGELLHRFTLWIDYGHKQFALMPNRAHGKPFEFDMSGAFLTTRDASFTAVVIRDVLDGSPAQAAGLKAGDEIKAIDGNAVTPGDLDEVRALFRHPDATHQLTIVRDGAESAVTLVTRRLL